MFRLSLTWKVFSVSVLSYVVGGAVVGLAGHLVVQILSGTILGILLGFVMRHARSVENVKCVVITPTGMEDAINEALTHLQNGDYEDVKIALNNLKDPGFDPVGGNDGEE